MAYATPQDIMARTGSTMTQTEQIRCSNMLDDAAIIIDSYNPNATADAKKVVSCRMVIRASGNGADAGVPLGATQGSMSALGYSQSWTIGSNGSTGELYLSKLEKRLLGTGDSIGSYSPTQELVPAPIVTEVL